MFNYIKEIIYCAILLFLSVTLLAQGAGNALDFDGTDDFVTISSVLSATGTAATFEAWIYPTSSSGNQVIVYHADNGEMAIMVSGSTLEVEVKLDDENWYGAGVSISSINKWYHIAGVWEKGGSIRVYVNGSLGNSTNVPDYYLWDCESATHTNIGSYNVGERDHFKGKIDEVRIWSNARTVTEIRENMYRELSNPSSEENLVAYYQFNGDANDMSSNSNNGTVNGATYKISGAFAGPRYALDFDGIDDYVSVPDNDAHEPASITVEAWFNITGTSETKIGDHTNQYLIFKQNMHESSFEGYAIFYTEAEGEKCVSGVVSNGTVQKVVSSPANSITFGKWYHIALVADNSDIALYFNGILQESVATGFSLDYGSNPLYFGRTGSVSYDGYFNGKLDEIRIWNMKRTAAQIQDNMCKSISGDETNLVAYYRCEQQEGTTVYDLTSTANHGTLNNMNNSDWVSSSAYNTWIGSEGTGWATDGNWSRYADPVSTDNVGIPDQASDPVISAASSWNNLVVCENANLTMNYSSGVSPGSKTFVNGTLTMTSGNIATTSSNLLTLGTSGTISGGSASSFINGPMAKTVNSTSIFTFPIGKNSTFRQIGITPSSADETTFTAEYFDEAYSNTSSLSGLNNVSTVEYFTLDRTGDANASVLLHWGANSGVSNLSDLRVARWDGAQWTDAGNSGTTGDASAGTITSNEVTSFSPFTFGSASGDNSLPVGLTGFRAIAGNGQVSLQWTTESELDNLGFNLYRSTKSNNQFSIINDQLIPGAGNSSIRHEYEYIDKNVTNGITYYYKLEDVDYSRNTRIHGPVSATPVEKGIPKEFRLYPNYPNPFNPVTTISYDLSENGYVELVVYNLRGEKVTTLIQSNQAVGSYKINWDGTNQHGELVTSGLYFLRIVSGNYSKTNKMVFIR